MRAVRGKEENGMRRAAAVGLGLLALLFLLPLLFLGSEGEKADTPDACPTSRGTRHRTLNRLEVTKI